ncbi:hypothetical protein M2152_001030 [Microbacteriaceae bacterium SG_E_30_P1]|uniref:Lipoprotein n=1 Tax=Antiquaquibacter oligotrophicus TaxID=2880260 RepID=A0ABT6KN34_9MICO|nr:hypothetical protein [Antiquaquibacter oligotrophicus]MDH6180848.1 hypothetical protein [Antiquaquibacter oligotrophicus]UDF13438.1 hypothetical protein LH407_00840 [Antiquaquibacter oligotrophicus]
MRVGAARRAAIVAVLASAALVITACSSDVTPPSITATRSPTSTVPSQPDVAAIEALIYALEALEPYAGTPDAAEPTAERCAYLDTVAESLAAGAPLPEYSDLYSDIVRDTAFVARSCRNGPLDDVGRASAESARAGVVTILNQQQVMGNDTWH